MTKRRPRHLSRDERELWEKVASSATPLLRAKPLFPLLDEEDLETAKHAPKHKPKKQRFDQRLEITPAGRIPPIVTKAAEAAPSLNMDRRAFQKMKKGKSKPEARIDLHGMTMAQAHPALTGFILRAHADQKRLVLVITGKGRKSVDTGPIPMRQGILRHQVPQWLSLAPLGPLVLQVSEAHQSHGGGGAYYVYLRRHR